MNNGSAFDWDGAVIVPGTHRFSHQAMATVFELFIYYEDQTYAMQAAQAAFTEIDRLELELSRFIDNSDIGKLNSLKINETARIGADAFECLQRCTELHRLTGGAFDVTVGHLLACRMNPDKSKREPTQTELSLARQRTGMHLIELNEEDFSVQVLADHLMLDLGGFGKGYAVDKIAGLLADWEINAALIHGGKSSVLATAPPEKLAGWPVTVSEPGDHRKILRRILLTNRSLSGSGIRKGKHIIDPRTGEAVSGVHAAWALANDAATADALSTAFMILSPEEIADICTNRKDIGAMILQQDGKINTFGKLTG